MPNKPSDIQECTNKRQALSQLRRKKWNESIAFKTDAQKTFFNTIDSHAITFCVGPAGTGKSFISLYYALQALADKKNPIDGIILCRPLIPIDNESIGYLPGTVEEKTDPHMLAYWQNIEKLVGKQRLQVLTDCGIIKVIPLAFFRGITLDNKVIIYDEAQNSTPTAMKSFLTRLGENSKMVIMGDMYQSDLKKTCGLEDAVKRLLHMKEVGLSTFVKADIVRHSLIEKILENYDESSESLNNFIESMNFTVDKVVKNGHVTNGI